MKTLLQYQNGQLCFGEKAIPLVSLISAGNGPFYVYDLAHIERRFRQMSEATARAGKPAQICFALKANPHPEVLRRLQGAGAGADVVSGGEIRRALECGFPPEQIIYSGVGKTIAEIDFALVSSVGQLNVESLPELRRIGERARNLKKRARVAFRLNPDVSIQTHPYIATGLAENKFGMELSLLPEIQKLIAEFSQELEPVGLSLHLGSQMQELGGFREALRRLVPVWKSLAAKWPNFRRFDAGGGLGVSYEAMDLEQDHALLQSYAQILREELAGLDCELQLEPGRWLVVHGGVLITQVQYVKPTSSRTFVIVDSGMNHLLRPALYQAQHQIWPLKQSAAAPVTVDVVGPICESADFFAKNYPMTPAQAGDYLAIVDVGAYGASMASTYNLQDLPREICI